MADSPMVDASAPRVSCGFRGKRRKSRLTCGHKGRHNQRVGSRWKGTKKKSNRGANRDLAAKAKRDLAAKAKVIKRQKTAIWQHRRDKQKDAATIKKGKETIKTLAADLQREQKDKEENYLKCPHARKDYAACTPSAQYAKRKELSNLLEKGRERLRMPKLTDTEMSLTEQYWKETFATEDITVAMDDDSEQREDEDMAPNADDGPEVFGATWHDKWERLFRLRGVADSEGACSTTVLRRIFMAAEMNQVTGGKLDELRKAMDNGISKVIEFHELQYEGVHAGVWLEPADVIRQMLMAAAAEPGRKYKINVLGDGRCFGSARNTTFFALRIVYLDGFSSTSNEAIWPLAILDTPEKRGPLRLLTQELRNALRHVQEKGLHLPEEYCGFVGNDKGQGRVGRDLDFTSCEGTPGDGDQR